MVADKVAESAGWVTINNTVVIKLKVCTLHVTTLCCCELNNCRLCARLFVADSNARTVVDVLSTLPATNAFVTSLASARSFRDWGRDRGQARGLGRRRARIRGNASWCRLANFDCLRIVHAIKTKGEAMVRFEKQIDGKTYPTKKSTDMHNRFRDGCVHLEITYGTLQTTCASCRARNAFGYQ